MQDNGEHKPKLDTHIVALNYFSILFIVAGIFLVSSLESQLTVRLIYFSLWIYLIPPILARLIIKIFGKPVGIVGSDSHTHTIWWVLFQLQILFNRFPFLEEVLKVVPGLYATWLNLWGAKVSTFSFWAPGVTVMDRYHLNIGKGVILGTECLLSGHVLVKKEDGSIMLVVDKLTIDSNALIGVRSMLSPGCHIHDSQIVAAQQTLKPYTNVKDSKKSLMKDISYK